MKKTLTLLAMAALFTSASFAQHNQHDNNYGNNWDRDIAVNNNRGMNGHDIERGKYYFSARERDMQISTINRDYYRKIESVKNKFYMGRSKKERLICSLEMQREAEIHSINARFNDRRNRFNRRDKGYYERDRRDKW